jgi:hypothetical protein
MKRHVQTHEGFNHHSLVTGVQGPAIDGGSVDFIARRKVNRDSLELPAFFTRISIGHPSLHKLPRYCLGPSDFGLPLSTSIKKAHRAIPGAISMVCIFAKTSRRFQPALDKPCLGADQPGPDIDVPHEKIKAYLERDSASIKTKSL